MAPIELPHPVSYTQLGIAATHAILVIYLTYAVGASIYTSYKSLGPSQQTRSRLAQRAKLAPAFLVLAAAAVSLATFSFIKAAALSYNVWAYERGIDLPSRIAGENGTLPDMEHSSQLYIGNWLADTPFYVDLLEIVTEKARRFWWGQQIDLATMSWSMLLATEGRRRMIPMLAAFMALAQLVSLSYAQNLFYLALLYTPAPLQSAHEELELSVIPVRRSTLIRLRNHLFPPKPKNWSPSLWVFYPVLALHFGSAFMLPYAAGTPSFVSWAIALRVSTVLPLVIPVLTPQRWGVIQTQNTEFCETTPKIFRLISAFAFLLHAKATVVGLTLNTPNSHFHRHSVLMPWDIEKRSSWERSTTAIGKILGSVSDHPAVLAAGCDVLVSTFSLGLWAATRATDPKDLLQAAVPFYGIFFRDEVAEISREVRSNSPESVVKREPDSPENLDEEPGRSRTLRRRGRRSHQRVTSVASVASSSAASEDTTNTGPVTRKRGRPKKVQPVEEKTYEPTPSEAFDVVDGDVLPSGDLDWESCALVWGLAASCGLATACSGVYGAEGPSRKSSGVL